MPRVAQAVRRPDVAGDPEHRHHRQIGQEARIVRLSRSVVLHGVRQLDQPVVGLLPLDQVLASHFDRLDFGLQVRPGHAVETPEDLEPQWYGERPGEDADRHREAGEPGPTVLGRSESGPAPTRPSEHVPERHGEDGAEREGREGHATPHLVQPVGRRVDGDQREHGAPGVEQRVASLGRNPLDPVREAAPACGERATRTVRRRGVGGRGDQHGVWKKAWHTRMALPATLIQA